MEMVPGSGQREGSLQVEQRRGFPESETLRAGSAPGSGWSERRTAVQTGTSQWEEGEEPVAWTADGAVRKEVVGVAP